MTTAGNPDVSVDHDDHFLHMHPGSDTLVVYFSALNVEKRKFNFMNLGRALPTHALFVNDLTQRWYQHGVAGLGASLDETCASIQGMAERLGATQIRAVGSSMGAFGALLATRIPGCAALAFSPECRLGLPRSRSRKSYCGDIVPGTADLRTVLTQDDIAATIVFGESEPMDLSAAAQFAGIGALELIGLRGVDHYASSHLNRAGVLEAALQRFFDKRALGDLESLPRAPLEHGQWRPLAGVGGALGAGAYPRTLLEAHLAEIRAEWPEMLERAEKAVALYPQGDMGWRMLGRARLMHGRIADSIGPLGAALALAERDPLTRYYLANAMRKLGMAAEARRHLRILIRRWPDFGRAYYELSLLAQADGDMQDAVGLLEQGVQAEPRRTVLRDRLADLQRRIGAATPAEPGAST
ncbi:MAG: hypothetical protein ACI8U3_001856 [Brevundimonas sp.]|jgi:hypothetical protein|uniref:tetratricopeptide repeat protein n=1 Tax=Brevundimonas sp. TaxID=1871086 RepID=UPI0039E37F60